MSPALAAALDRARFVAARLGWPGLAGLALLAGAVVALLVAVPGREAGAVAAREAAGRSQADYQALLKGDGQGQQDAAGTLARFRDGLMSVQEADAAMENLQQLALKHGLATAGTEYKWQRQPGARLAEVRIALPVKAGYAAVHAFVRDALADVPGLALDQFEVQRDAIGSGGIDARLRFALFLRVES